MRVIALFAVAIAALLQGGAAYAQKRLAFIVGNDAYQAVPVLQKAVNDARTMSDSLARVGFEVVRVENAGRQAMAAALSDFDGKIGKGDLVAFFFAGHGFEIRSVNYLLPIDVPAAREGQEELVKDASFAVDQLVERFQSKGASTVLMVLDACRDNPFPQKGTRAVSGTRGLARMDAPEGVFILFSAGAKQTALDRLDDADRDPNSVFTRMFVGELLKKDRTLVEIAKATQVGVRSLAGRVGHTQTPAYYDQIVGDVTLSGTGVGRVIVETPPLPAAPQTPQVATLPPQGGVTAAPPTRVAGFPGGATAVPAPVLTAAAPIVQFQRSNQGWHSVIQIPEAATAISFRIGETGDFEDTGHLPTIDSRTGKPMPNPSFQLPASQKTGTIYLQYVDAWGRTIGPFPILFSPMASLVASQKQALEMTWTSWVAFRNDPDYAHLLYTSQLVSFRCAIKQATISIDDGPVQVLPLPACDEKNPSAIPSNFTPYIKIAKTAKKAVVQLTYVDGTQTKARTIER